MNNLAQLEMTLAEAQETDRLIKRHINTTRYLLMDMRDRNGWKVLGYESFGDYGKKSLGYEKAYLTQLADAGEISLQLGYDPEFAIANSIPKETHLRPLKQVPEEVRKEIWDEAIRKADEEHAKRTAKHVEEAVAEWKQRQQESQAESNERRKKINELEQQIDLLKSQPKPEKIEVPPADYDSLKAKSTELDKIKEELTRVKKEQTSLVDEQVRAKLKGYQDEVNEMEIKKAIMQKEVDGMKAYMASLESEVKRIETHREVIDGVRLKLINLAAFLSDEEPIQDAETLKRWRALAGMLGEAMTAINQYAGDAKPALTVIAGGAA